MSEDFSSGEDFLSTIQENLATILIEKFNEIDLDSIDWVRLAKIVGGYFLTGNRQIKGVGNLIPDNMLISFRNRFRKEVSDSRALDLQKKEIVSLSKVSTLSQLRRITPRNFELWTAYYLQRMGYENVKITPGSGDFGIDVYAVSKSRKRMVVQCKHYHAVVGTPVIQQTYGAMKLVDADLCCVAVTGQISDNGFKLAKKHSEIILLEGKKMIADLGEKK